MSRQAAKQRAASCAGANTSEKTLYWFHTVFLKPSTLVMDQWPVMMTLICHQHNTGRLSTIARVNVVLNRTIVDSDRRFDNLSGSHLQRQSELYHVR